MQKIDITYGVRERNPASCERYKDMLIINNIEGEFTSSNNCTRIDLAGGFGGYGFAVVRDGITRHGIQFGTVTVRQDGATWGHLYIRAFGKTLFAREWIISKGGL